MNVKNRLQYVKNINEAQTKYGFAINLLNGTRNMLNNA